MNLVRIPFSLRRYDLDDPEVWKRLPEITSYSPGSRAPGRCAARGARDKFPPPPPPDNGRRANGARPS